MQKSTALNLIDTLLVSGHKRIQIDELLEKINEYRKGKMRMS